MLAAKLSMIYEGCSVLDSFDNRCHFAVADRL